MGPLLRYSAWRPEAAGNWLSQDTTPAQTQSQSPPQSLKKAQSFDRAHDSDYGFNFQVSLTWSGFMTKYPVEEGRQSDAAADV